MKRFLCVVLLAASIGAQTATEIPDDAWGPIEPPPSGSIPRRLLIQKHAWLEGNEAVLLEDAESVRRIFELLRGNEVAMHACGFHWQLTFEIGEQRYWSVPFNQECEQFRRANAEIQKFVHGYIEQITKQPKQYLIDVAIAPREDVEPVRQRLQEAGYRVLLLRSNATRYPYVRLEAAAAGRMTSDDDYEIAEELITRANKRVQDGIDLLRQRGHLVEAGPIREAGSGSLRPKLFYAATADVALSWKFRPEDVQRYPAFLSFCEYFVPTEYVLNVVVDEQLSPKLEARIRQVVPSVRRIGATPTSMPYDDDAVKELRCPMFSEFVEEQ